MVMIVLYICFKFTILWGTYGGDIAA